MRIHRMTAAFGRHQEQTLELRDGLNILQTPNETGKSTWCTFLLSMFYGAGERTGSPEALISSRLDCTAGEDALTLLRAAQPQETFQALRTGTDSPMPGLTGDNCGEKLLGVSREVYAHTAFIRQSAAGRPPSEDDSYTEAAAALKTRLNRRGKTLPALEAELQETAALLASQADLVRQREGLLARSTELEARKTALEEELSVLDRWDMRRQRQALRLAEDAADLAEEKAASLRRRMEEELVPENAAIGRLRGAIVNLNTVRKNAEKAQEEYQSAKAALAQTETRLAASPFNGQTAEEARATAQDPIPDYKRPLKAVLLTAVLGLCAAAAAGYGVWLYIHNLTASLGTAGAVLAAALIAVFLVWKQTDKKARKAALIARYSTADLSDIVSQADIYTQLLTDRDTGKQAVTAKAAAAQGLWQSVDMNADGILAEVRRFAPGAYDIPSADAALRASAILRKELSEAEKNAQKARAQAELQARQIPAPDQEDPEPVQPPRKRETVALELERAEADLSAMRSSLDRIAGRLQATGDPLTLRAAAERLTDEIAVLEKEHAAIELAMSPLAHAGIQPRSAADLGTRAAEIFDQLNGAIPQETDSPSAGTQLYLAVRLAICDLVLPADDPIVLDDALAGFDGACCAAALDVLRKESERRQILLFTSQDREAAHFKNDPAVSVQVLGSPNESL